jgi:hypothetical protein
MKPYDNDEELDRALFALELEEPPAGMRTSILAATIYRPPVPVQAWEIWVLGGLCAVLAWFLALAAHGSALPAFSTLSGYVNDAVSYIAKPETLFWIAAGGGLTLWISQLNLTIAPGALRATRR